MTDERLRHLYVRGVDARSAPKAGRGAADVAPETLLALARGELPEEERLALFDRVMADARSREEFALLRALVVAERAEGTAVGAGAPVVAEAPERAGADPDVIPLRPRASAAAPAAPAARPAWRRHSTLLAAAATLVVAVGVGGLMTGAEPELMRGEADAITLVEPPADAAATDSLAFVWRAVPGAARYTFELLDAGGMPIYETTTLDTAVALPAAVSLQPGTDYRWLVRATDDTGADRGSAVRRLRVRAE